NAPVDLDQVEVAEFGEIAVEIIKEIVLPFLKFTTSVLSGSMSLLVHEVVQYVRHVRISHHCVFSSKTDSIFFNCVDMRTSTFPESLSRIHPPRSTFSSASMSMSRSESDPDATDARCSLTIASSIGFTRTLIWSTPRTLRRPSLICCSTTV